MSTTSDPPDDAPKRTQRMMHHILLTWFLTTSQRAGLLLGSRHSRNVGATLVRRGFELILLQRQKYALPRSPSTSSFPMLRGMPVGGASSTSYYPKVGASFGGNDQESRRRLFRAAEPCLVVISLEIGRVFGEKATSYCHATVPEGCVYARCKRFAMATLICLRVGSLQLRPEILFERPCHVWVRALRARGPLTSGLPPVASTRICPSYSLGAIPGNSAGRITVALLLRGESYSNTYIPKP